MTTQPAATPDRALTEERIADFRETYAWTLDLAARQAISELLAETARLALIEAERDALIYFMVDGLGYSGQHVREQMLHIASLDIDLAARAEAALAPATPTERGGSE